MAEYDAADAAMPATTLHEVWGADFVDAEGNLIAELDVTDRETGEPLSIQWGTDGTFTIQL